MLGVNNNVILYINGIHRPRSDLHHTHQHRTHVPYCGPLDAQHHYRPMFAPHGVGFTSPPVQVPPLGPDETRMLPVMRIEDNYPIPFYYYADGCSDMYVRANRTTARVLHDRVHALRTLADTSTEASNALREYCRQILEDSAVHTLTRQLLSSDNTVDLTGIRSAISGSGCLNTWLYTRMKVRGIHTLVLNYENPGNDHTGAYSSRKIEVVHVGPLYGPDKSTACELRALDGCTYCAGSNRSLSMCSRALALAPLAPKRGHLTRTPR